LLNVDVPERLRLGDRLGVSDEDTVGNFDGEFVAVGVSEPEGPLVCVLERVMESSVV